MAIFNVFLTATVLISTFTDALNSGVKLVSNNAACGFSSNVYNTNVGDALLIHCCVADGKFLAFSHNGALYTEHNSNPDYFVFKQSKGNILKIYTLVLSRVGHADSGRFDCIVDGGRCRTEVRVEGREGQPGSISFHYRHLYVKSGSDANLTCARPNNQTFEGFYKNHLKIKVDSRHQIKNLDNTTNLMIKKMRRDDAGVFMCRAGGETAVLKLSIKFAVKDLKFYYTMMKSKTGEISCNVEGELTESEILITWSKFREEPGRTWNEAASTDIAARYGRFSQTITDKYKVKENGSLMIIGISYKDAGYYRITVDGDIAGVFSKIVKVIVI